MSPPWIRYSFKVVPSSDRAEELTTELYNLLYYTCGVHFLPPGLILAVQTTIASRPGKMSTFRTYARSDDLHLQWASFRTSDRHPQAQGCAVCCSALGAVPTDDWDSKVSDIVVQAVKTIFSKVNLRSVAPGIVAPQGAVLQGIGAQEKRVTDATEQLSSLQEALALHQGNDQKGLRAQAGLVPTEAVQVQDELKKRIKEQKKLVAQENLNLIAIRTKQREPGPLTPTVPVTPAVLTPAVSLTPAGHGGSKHVSRASPKAEVIPLEWKSALGLRLRMKWHDGAWYTGRITSVLRHKIEIAYDDDDNPEPYEHSKVSCRALYDKGELIVLKPT